MNSSADFNRSCEEAQLFGIQIVRDDVETALRYFSIGFVSLMFPFSVCLTSFTIFLILKFKHLRQTTFLLALQLLILDLVISITFVPASIVGAANGQWPWVLGLPFCKLTHAIIAFTYVLRGWLMFVFVCDRFCTVFAPLHYPKYRSNIIWTLYGVVLVITTINIVLELAFDCSGFNRQLWVCISNFNNKECPNKLICESIITSAIIVENLLFGSFAPIVMYTALFIKAKKIRNRILPASKPEDAEQRKRDRRVNLTFFSIFLSLIGIVLPPTATYIIISSILIPLEVEPPEFLLVMTYLLQGLYIILPTSDSIAILRNPEVRKATERIKLKLFSGILRERSQEITTTLATTETSL